MFIVKNVDVELCGVGIASGGMYEMTGPESNLDKLIEMCQRVGDFDFETKLPADSSRKKKQVERRNHVRTLTRGGLSPLNRITMGPATRASLFIPADACYLAFLHPAKALEKALEATNISDDPWAYLLLIGGFAFFDADRKLQSVNALSLTPTRHEMHFDGPHEMDSEDIARLRVQGRLHEVFMDALQEQGLHECAWVHPNETIGDIATRESEPDAPGTRKQFAYGALVYITESGEGICFGVALNKPAALRARSFKSHHDLFHNIKQIKKKVERDIDKMKTESARVSKFTDGEPRGVHNHSTCRWLPMGIMALILMPLLSCLVTVLTLGTLAWYDTRIFDIVATLVWFNLYVGTTWHPLRDTAGGGIGMHSPQRLFYIRAFLAAIPILLSLILIGVYLFNWQAHAKAVEHVHATMKILNELLVFVALPALIYHFRLLTCRDVSRAMASEYAAVQQLVKLSVQQGHLKRESTDKSVADTHKGPHPTRTTTYLAQSPPPSPPQDAMRVPKQIKFAPSSVEVSATLDDGIDEEVTQVNEITIVAQPISITQSQSSTSTMEKPFKPIRRQKKDARRSSVQRTKVKRLGELLYEIDLVPPEGFTAEEVAVAIRMQLAFRGFQARKRMREERGARLDALMYFSVPIYACTLFKVASGSALSYLTDRTSLIDNGILYSLLGLVPCIVCLFLKDLRKKPLPRFSLAHGMFFVAVLYRLCFVAAKVDSIIFAELRERYGTESALPPIGALAFHYTLYMSVTAIGGQALNLVATRNGCVHLMFFFQFFDFFFVYVFFNTRSIEADGGITGIWILQQCLMQVIVFLRNSGTFDAITRLVLRRLLAATGSQGTVQLTLNDPVYRLQYLARMAIQFDLADWTAVLLTPSVVTFFVWRDGYFTLENTGIFVNGCLLRGLWIRFVLLLVFKQVGSTLGRMLMNRKMRKTLLGKKTIHGRSQVVIKALSAHKVSLKRATLGEESKGMLGKKEAKAQEDLGLTEEQRFAIGNELLMSAMNYKVLVRKQLKHVKFYTMVTLLQLFVAMPIRQTAMKETYSGNVTESLALLSLTKSNFDLVRLGHTSPSVGSHPHDTLLHTNRSSHSRAAFLMPDLFYVVPQQSSWVYVPPVMRYYADEQLQRTLQSSRFPAGVVACTSTGWQPHRSDAGFTVFMGVALVVAVLVMQLLCMKLIFKMSPQETRELRRKLCTIGCNRLRGRQKPPGRARTTHETHHKADESDTAATDIAECV